MLSVSKKRINMYFFRYKIFSKNIYGTYYKLIINIGDHEVKLVANFIG